MKTISKKLLSIITATVVSSGLFVTSNVSAATTVDSSKDTTVKTAAKELASIYKTNPDGNVGKEKTITIDGDASDWSSDMLIAQGAANDSCTAFKGQHENCVLDSYSLYAAWDDDNLYVGWQMVNSTDVWAREGDGPLSDGGRILDVPLGIALSVDPNKKMTGNLTDGKGIWNLKVQYKTPIDHLFLMSGKVGLGTPAMFTPCDDEGNGSYDKKYCQEFKTLGVKYKMAETSIPDKIIGVDNPQGVDDIYSDSSNWVNFLDLGHNRKYDSFYEMSIPLSALGIDKDYIEKNGIGILQLATRGESGIDCLPHDDSMLDHATEEYGGAHDNTSHEKDDTDIITTKLADIGKIRDGGVVKNPKIDSVNTNVTSPQDLGSTIKFTTLASSGTGTLQYQYEVNGTVAQSYSTNSIFNWTPKTAGEYNIKVTVKDSEGATATKTVSYTIKDKPVEEVKITSFTSNLASPQKVNTAIKLTTKATGGNGTLKYKFTVNNNVLQNYSTSSSATWTPKTAGTYTLTTYVSDDNGATYKTKTMDYVVNGEDTTTLKITATKTSLASPQNVGTSIKLSMAAKGKGTVKYRFVVLKDGAPTFVRGYKSIGYTAWQPTEAGNYTIYFKAKDSTGKEVSKTMNYVINKQVEGLTINSIKTSLVSPQKAGQAIKLTTDATSEGSMQYRYWVYDSNGEWTLLRNYSSNKSLIWTPNKAGDYIIFVDVKDSNGNIEGDFITYKIIK